MGSRRARTGKAIISDYRLDMATTVHKNLVVLARVLERLEHSTLPVDAQQYRTVVAHLTSEIAAITYDASLEAVLETFPATAEVFENMHYGRNGLSRSPTQRALGADLRARRLIARVRLQAAQQKR